MEKNIETKKINLALLVCLVGFPQISETIYTPSLTEIATSYGVSLNLAQMTLSIYFLAFAVGVFFWGVSSDFLGRRKAMNFGIFIYILGCFVCLFQIILQCFLSDALFKHLAQVRVLLQHRPFCVTTTTVMIATIYLQKSQPLWHFHRQLGH